MTLFAILDIETTGLKPENCYILEVAWVLTSKHLEQVGEPHSFLVDLGPDRSEAFGQIDASEFLTDMHTTSGLYQDLKTKTGTPMLDIRQAFVDDVMRVRLGDEQVRFGGLSVSFDREFLREHGWSSLLESNRLGFQMHHRILDLSSVIQMYEAKEREVPRIENTNAHRALDDVMYTLKLAQAFRDD